MCALVLMHTVYIPIDYMAYCIIYIELLSHALIPHGSHTNLTEQVFIEPLH